MIDKLLWPVILQILGVLVIIAEFILPSAGILTIASLGLFIYSLYMVFTTISTGAGLIFLVIDLLMLPVLIVIGVKILAASPVTLRATLKNDPADLQNNFSKDLIGSRGYTLTDLRPAGKAVFGEKKYDVVSQGSFISHDIQIEICAINSNRIVVRQVNPDDDKEKQNNEDTL